MSKYLSIYTDELNKCAGLGQIIAPMAKGLISRGVSGLTNLAKPALTSVAKVEAPGVATGAGKAIGGTGKSLGASAIKAEAPAVTSLASKTVNEGAQGLRSTTPPATFLPQPATAPQPATFLPELPKGSNLLADAHNAKINFRQAHQQSSLRNTPENAQKLEQMQGVYQQIMQNLGKYNIPKNIIPDTSKI